MAGAQQWEDPATWSDWIARLAEKLVERDQQYIGLKAVERMKLDPDQVGNDEIVETDPRANATLTAASTVSVVVSALMEIPTFETGWGVATLRDVATSLTDADAGARPKLFEPRPDVKPAKIGTGRRLLMATIVLGVELLKASGVNEAEACGFVAGVFTDVGHRGRKGGPLSAKTVQEWCSKSGDDIKMRVVIDGGLSQWRHGLSWPPERVQAENFARSKAMDPFLLTQI